MLRRDPRHGRLEVDVEILADQHVEVVQVPRTALPIGGTRHQHPGRGDVLDLAGPGFPTPAHQYRGADLHPRVAPSVRCRLCGHVIRDRMLPRIAGRRPRAAAVIELSKVPAILPQSLVSLRFSASCDALRVTPRTRYSHVGFWSRSGLLLAQIQLSKNYTSVQTCSTIALPRTLRAPRHERQSHRRCS